MLKNYLKIALRNIVKNKGISIINLVGLSVSIAFCLSLVLYIRFEQSFDTFHQKRNHLFRLEMSDQDANLFEKPKKHFFSFLTKNEDIKNQIVFPLVAGPAIESNFPEIKSITRLKSEGDLMVKVNHEVYKEAHSMYVENNFFNNFSFPLVEGNPNIAFPTKNNVILSEELAHKYFGTVHAIGKVIEVSSDTTELFTVSGVAKDAPANSSIQFSMIFPLQAQDDYDENIKEGFNHQNHITIIELRDGVNADSFEKKIQPWVQDYYVKPYNIANGKYHMLTGMHWYLRPLVDCHYNSAGFWGHYTNADTIYQLACLVLIILLIASLNYILLAVTNTAARSQEVGVRKVIGANRKSIIFQFWMEAQVLVLLATLLGVVMARIALPLFNQIINTQISFDYFSYFQLIIIVLCLVILIGLVAGLYPALLISRMRPASMLKSFQTYKVKPGFSKILVVLQYAGSVVFIIAAVVINLQMRYISNKDLGFDKDQVLMVENPSFDPVFTKKVFADFEIFSHSEPSVLNYSAMAGTLDGGYNLNGFKLNGQQQWLRQISVDYNYFNLLGLHLVEGRLFMRDMATDTSQTYRPSVVNESLFKLLGTSAKVGQYNEAIRSTIIGIVKDYNFESLTKKIEPEQHRLANKYFSYFMFKIKKGRMSEAIAKIQEEWKKASGNFPFSYTFLDQSIAKMYEEEKRWQKTIQACCFFALVISCMGLFGISALNAMNRTKEIGIRKVLGASVQELVAVLSSNFLKMVCLSILIASPIAWWFMSQWLQQYAYRINFSWWIFVFSALSAIFIALISVGLQALSAARANPVNSLRVE